MLKHFYIHVFSLSAYKCAISKTICDSCRTKPYMWLITLKKSNHAHFHWDAKKKRVISRMNCSSFSNMTQLRYSIVFATRAASASSVLYTEFLAQIVNELQKWFEFIFYRPCWIPPSFCNFADIEHIILSSWHAVSLDSYIDELLCASIKPFFFKLIELSCVNLKEKHLEWLFFSFVKQTSPPNEHGGFPFLKIFCIG